MVSLTENRTTTRSDAVAVRAIAAGAANAPPLTAGADPAGRGKAQTYPLVAIVTPVYNGEEFLAETMETVQAQTYPNLVHIILENASTDRTPEIIASFQDRKTPLRVSRNLSLLSMMDNWNRAAELIPAEASYFLYLCADDGLRPDAISRMVEIAERDAKVMVVTSSSVTRNGELQDFGWPHDQEIYDGADVIRRLFTKPLIMDARIAMFRRSALELHAPFFDSALKSAEDTDAVLRAVAAGKLGLVNEPVAMVREHYNNASHTVTRPMRLHYLDHWVIIQRYAQIGLNPRERQQMFRDYRRYYLRRLMAWRWADGNRQAYDFHVRQLSEMGFRPKALQFLDAAIDLAVKRARSYASPYTFPGDPRGVF